MLEDEVAYVLSQDSELAQLILVENGEHFRIQRKLQSQGCLPTLIPLDRVPELLTEEQSQLLAILKPFCGFRFIEKICRKLEDRNKTKVTVVANILKRELHDNVELIKPEMYRNIREMSQFSDRILIFYGICGHSLANLEKDFEGLGCPLFFLKDDNGEIVEDCISVALGGNDIYAKTLKSEGDATFYYFTPMWASRWMEFPKESLSSPERNYMDQYLKRYGRIAKVNTGLSYEPDFDENVRDCARFLNLKIVELQGSKKIAEKGYQNAKTFL